jgi:hypothetical protein
MSWYSILTIELSLSEGLKIIVGPIFFVFLFLVIVCSLWYAWKRTYKKWDVVEINLNFKNPLSVKIKPNHDVIRVAHQVWTELQTRKAALPFDEKNDVVLEVYDSWYILFGIIRNLIKTIPAEHIRNNKDTEELVNLLVDVLNLGLRPHLTQWQARFRVWIKANEDVNLSPQEQQKKFPKYGELTSDLKMVNEELNKFSASLYSLVHGK